MQSVIRQDRENIDLPDIESAFTNLKKEEFQMVTQLNEVLMQFQKAQTEMDIWRIKHDQLYKKLKHKERDFIKQMRRRDPLAVYMTQKDFSKGKGNVFQSKQINYSFRAHFV